MQKLGSMISTSVAATICPVIAGAIKETMKDDERQVNEQLLQGVESGKVRIECKNSDTTVEINGEAVGIASDVKFEETPLVNDAEDSELKNEFRRFQYEFNKKTKSKEEKLPRKLRNGW